MVRKAEPDPLTWLDQKLKVEARPGTEFMRVSIEGDNGDELRTLLDAVAKAYQADVDERDNGARRRRLSKLDDTHRAYRTELDGYQKRVETIAKVLGSKDGPTLAVMDSVLQDELRQAAREYAAAREQVRLAELEVPAAALPGAAVALPPPPEGVIDEELRRDAGLQLLEAEVVQARQVLTDTEALFEKGKVAPQLTRAKEAVRAAEEKRDKYRADRRPQIESVVREAVKKADDERRGEAVRAVDRLKNKTELAKERLTEVERKIAKVSEYRLELEGIKRNVDQTEKLAARLADEIEQVKVEVGAPPRVTLAEEPYVVPGIEGNRRLKFTLIVAGVVLAVGFAGVVGWEYRARRVVHAGEVTSEIGLPLLGTLPPAGAGEGNSSLALVEAIDTTRTMLLHAGGMRSVLVTSAVSGEGKTSLAGHLAISLARGGFRTLLVDGDFHSPSAHRLFGLPDGPGLSEALRGEAQLESAIHPSPLPGLGRVDSR